MESNTAGDKRFGIRRLQDEADTNVSTDECTDVGAHGGTHVCAYKFNLCAHRITNGVAYVSTNTSTNERADVSTYGGAYARSDEFDPCADCITDVIADYISYVISDLISDLISDSISKHTDFISDLISDSATATLLHLYLNGRMSAVLYLAPRWQLQGVRDEHHS